MSSRKVLALAKSSRKPQYWDLAYVGGMKNALVLCFIGINYIFYIVDAESSALLRPYLIW